MSWTGDILLKRQQSNRQNLFKDHSLQNIEGQVKFQPKEGDVDQDHSIRVCVVKGRKDVKAHDRYKVNKLYKFYAVKEIIKVNMEIICSQDLAFWVML